MANFLIPTDETAPSHLPILPLENRPIFPGLLIPLVITEQKAIDTVTHSMSTGAFLGLILRRKDNEGDITIDDLYRVGVAAKIAKHSRTSEGGFNILINTLRRFRIKKTLSSDIPFIVAVNYLKDIYDPSAEKEITALTRALISEMKQIVESNQLLSEEMRLNMVNIDNPGRVTDIITSLLNLDKEKQQEILEITNVQKRMETVLVCIKREQELLRIQRKIQKQINERIDKSQREYFLREELKAIKQELGVPTDAKKSEVLRMQEKLKTLPMPDETREQIEKELEKFSFMETVSPEYQMTWGYLETILNLPWHPPEPIDIDMGHAQKILDKDHYGLEDVKERILEFIAVSKMRKTLRGFIICLVGPPGVGKTSVGKSIARALNKEFFRFSVGGMRDEAEIKGHRRTYIGAMPGKIIQGLKVVKTCDPVFMIDEIDKLKSSYQGDPSAALLEVLDPEQNKDFRDHYLDIKFDISNILFIATANTLDTIPRPLLDRMEVIRLAGYIDSEKVAIARKYLIPRSLQQAGLPARSATYTAKSLLHICNNYTRESGVRNLEKSLHKIHRKLARTIAEEKGKPPFKIDIDQLDSFLGIPYHHSASSDLINRAGMAIGLAWTPTGGETLIIEAALNPGKAKFSLTGQLGDVMQESARIAYTWVRSMVTRRFSIPPEFFEQNEIHLHIPAGATPKDGPSAGITIATCLTSLILQKKVSKKLAMTGELSLVGHVLPIGGLKEKVIAAKRNKITQIIYPAENYRDFQEIPEHVTKGLAFHSVETMEQVISLLW